MNGHSDILIIGGGIAGMTAALYAARANLSVRIVEKEVCGGLVNWTHTVENVPSYKSIHGMDLMTACREHVESLGVAIEEVNEVEEVRLDGQPKEIRTSEGDSFTADVVIIAIKPYQIESVIKPIADEFAKNGRFVVSIAAGWDLAKYQKLFGDLAQSIHIQCTIPNTPMAVGKGVLVTETDNTLTDMQTEVFESLFGPISLIERVDTAHMTIAMVVAGCAPAFTDMYIEALGDAGVQYGLQRATAYRLAAKMVEGVGALYMATGTHPGAMKDAVCSPGGTTIRGVAKLEKDGFRGAVIDAVDAIVG